MGLLDFLKPKPAAAPSSTLEDAFGQAVTASKAGTKTLFISDFGGTQELWPLIKKNNWPVGQLQENGLLRILHNKKSATQEELSLITQDAIDQGIQLIVFHTQQNPGQPTGIQTKYVAP
ncbi:hypothetical protein ACFLQ2_02770 [archaeon]